MSVTHEECREAVAAGEQTAARSAHLAQCAECRSFAAQMNELDRVATALAPPPAPAGLADRVLARIPPARTEPPRTKWPLIVGVAAASLLVAGIVSAVATGDGPSEPRDRHQILLAAATHFEDDGASAVTVDASTDVEVHADGRRADFSGAPPEVRDHMAEEWDRMMTELDRQLADLDARIDETLERFDRQMNESFGGTGPTTDTDRRKAPEPPPARRPQPPARATLGIRISASGTVDPASGIQLQGTVSGVPGTIAVPEGEARFAIDASMEARAMRAPDGRWVQADLGTGPLGRVLLEARTIPAILRAAGPDVEDRGPVPVDDGSPATRYEFVVSGDSLGGGAGSWAATASIDGRGRVRAITLEPLGVEPSVRTRLEVKVGGAGAIDPARRPTEIAGRATPETASPFAPVAPAVRAALEGRTR